MSLHGREWLVYRSIPWLLMSSWRTGYGIRGHGIDLVLPQYSGFGTTWWRHQMETFSALLAICAGNSPVPVNSPHKGQWRGTLMFSFICVWITSWVNNRTAGDLRRYRAHYDVSAMKRANIHLRYREPKWVMFGTDEETSKYCFSSISIIIRFGQTLMMFVTVICTKLFSALAKLCKMN